MTGPQLLFGRWQSVNTKLSSWIIPKGQLMIKEKNNWMSDLINAVYNQSTFQFSSVAQSCPILCNPMNCSMPGLPVTTNSRSLLKFMSIKSVMPSNHLILWRPLLLPSIFPSIRVISNESLLRIRWHKYWSFSFSISLSNESPRFISFRTDWLDLLAVQGTLKSHLQPHSRKASIL